MWQAFIVQELFTTYTIKKDHLSEAVSRCLHGSHWSWYRKREFLSTKPLTFILVPFEGTSSHIYALEATPFKGLTLQLLHGCEHWVVRTFHNKPRTSSCNYRSFDAKIVSGQSYQDWVPIRCCFQPAEKKLRVVIKGTMYGWKLNKVGFSTEAIHQSERLLFKLRSY